MPSVQRLKQRFARTLKARKFDAALAALAQLANEEPEEPGWPRRAARLFHARSDMAGELAALRRALELQVDQGLVLDAIASCQSILAIAPDDARTLETLDLLYLEGTQPIGRNSGDVSKPKPMSGLRNRPDARSPVRDREAPLDSLILTDVIPGAQPMLIGDSDLGGVSEIPLDEPCVAAEEAPLDLNLDSSSSSSALLDVAAAQSMCLPAAARKSIGAGGQKAAQSRGASLRTELANVPLFGDLDPASLHTLIRRVRVETLAAGQVLFRQGDPANSLYIVVDGAVVPIAEGEPRRKLAVLERGEFFGEIGLMGSQPRNATIEAIVETKLLAIDRSLVWDLIADEPSVASGILRFLRARLIDRQMRTNLFFAAFAGAKREAVAKQFRFLEAEEGTQLVEEGRAPEGLFVVLSGSLSISRTSRGHANAEKEIGVLGLGDVFGGLSLMEGRPAEANVVARTKCWLVILGEGRFRRILEENPHLDRILRRIAKQRTIDPGENIVAL